METDRSIVIIGAGPAGLAAAHAAAERGLRPLVLEAGSQVGGLARTVVHHGNRIDIGGHRFFSRSERVMAWWLGVLPLQGAPAADDIAMGRDVPLDHTPGAPDPEVDERVMLARRRASHIYYLGRFFAYPVRLTLDTLRKLGLARTVRIGASYLAARLRPREERSLEDFFINRFGRALYELFFRDYTQKVWGVPCDQIDAEWGRQRIKGLSVTEVVRHALTSLGRTADPIEQRGTETSLIGWFLYPKLGPGQLWEEVARRAEELGARIELGCEVVGVGVEGGRVVSLSVIETATGRVDVLHVDCPVLSSMPLADLVARATGDAVPERVAQVAAELPFRDFITVGLLVDRVADEDRTGAPLRDNWIYMQDRDLRVGRVQIFNNWSPYLVAEKDATWMGLEYFCAVDDDLWRMSDDELVAFAADELVRSGLLPDARVRDSLVLRVEKAYPAYFSAHGRIDEVRAWADSVENLFVMGRNGMHRYNNMDDSMLTAWAALDAATGAGTRDSVWAVDSSGAAAE